MLPRSNASVTTACAARAFGIGVLFGRRRFGGFYKPCKAILGKFRRRIGMSGVGIVGGNSSGVSAESPKTSRAKIPKNLTRSISRMEVHSAQNARGVAMSIQVPCGICTPYNT